MKIVEKLKIYMAHLKILLIVRYCYRSFKTL